MTIFWTILTIFFLTLELTNLGLFYFLALAIGSLTAGTVAATDFDESTQYLAFFISCCVALTFLQYVVKKLLKEKATKSYLSNTSLLIGQTVEITVVLSEHLGHGKVGNETWAIEVKNSLPLKIGTTGIVTGISGCHLEINIIK